MENSYFCITDELKFIAEHLFEEFCELEDEALGPWLSIDNVDYEALWNNVFQKNLGGVCDEELFIYKNATLSIVRIVLESRARSRERYKHISKDLVLLESGTLVKESQFKLPF